MPFKVVLIESERGWGQRVDDVIYFNNIDRADEYIKDFNKDNTLDVAPDWYMVAQGPEFVREIPADKIARDEGLLL